VTETAFCPPGLLGTARPGTQVLRLTAAAVPHAPSGPGPAEAAAAMDRLRATAARTLSEHLNHDGACARCHLSWPCDHAHLAASALGAG
jgi:hypothetical protein